MLLLALTSCAREKRDPLVTYFNGQWGLSVRYPASWRTEEAEQEGVWYRYFLGHPTGPERKPSVSVTLLAGPLGGSLEDYARTYLAGHEVTSTRDESRQGAVGHTYELTSTDGKTRHSLVLLQEGQRVFGLYAQGESAAFASHAELLKEMAKSLTLERPAHYTRVDNEKYGFSIALPPSWQPTRSFSGGGTYFTQYASPVLAVDPNGQAVQASLTVTVESVAGEVSLEEYYRRARDKLGESAQLLSHTPWRGGWVDVMRMETPVATSRVKRFYWAGGGRGYSLSYDVREDVFSRVNRWYDLIASTFRAAPVVAPG